MVDEEKHLKLVQSDNPETLPAVRDISLPAMPDERIGAIRLTPEEREVLDRPPELDRVEVRPDPLYDGRPVIYLSHDWYRDRLRSALGFGSFGLKTIKTWGEEVENAPSKKKIIVYVWAALYVRGCFVADSIGSHDYFPDNRRQDYSDSFKAAKSNAFVRCCSDAGLGTEPWQTRFCEEFARQHCVKVLVKEDGKLQPRWRRKDAQPFENEQSSAASDPNKVPPIWQNQSSNTGSNTGFRVKDTEQSTQTSPARDARLEATTVIDLDAQLERQPATEEQVKQLEELTANFNPKAVQDALKQRRVKNFNELSTKQAKNIIDKLSNIEGA